MNKFKIGDKIKHIVSLDLGIITEIIDENKYKVKFGIYEEAILTEVEICLFSEKDYINTLIQFLGI